LVAGAAAALAARSRLEPARFELLFSPVAEVIPGGREVYTSSCMPIQSRPLPA
jgi:hypothetical protein